VGFNLQAKTKAERILHQVVCAWELPPRIFCINFHYFWTRTEIWGIFRIIWGI